MDLSSVILGANSPRFVNSQLACLLPVGIVTNWERGEGDFNMILKSPFRGVIIKDLLVIIINIIIIIIIIIIFRSKAIPRSYRNVTIYKNKVLSILHVPTSEDLHVA